MRTRFIDNEREPRRLLRGPSPVSVVHALLMLCTFACASSFGARVAHAQAEVGARWVLRSSLGYAALISGDQTGRMKFTQGGVTGDIGIGYAFTPWMELGFGSVGGAFFSEAPTGGLIAPAAFGLVRTDHQGLRPYLQLDVGAGLTGTLWRPFMRIGGGLELPIARELWLGPRVGLAVLAQTNDRGDSSDAQFLFAGLALAYAPRSEPDQQRPVAQQAPATRSSPPREPIEPAPPSETLIELLERAVPTDPTRVELLAPVLFALDSDQLEPIGEAMLHEVAHVLSQRADIRLLEIRGYADTRGSAVHNRALSQRRGERVKQWLVEHGVQAERLAVAPRGEASPLEVAGTEPAHQQNRRVVFRVLELGAP